MMPQEASLANNFFNAVYKTNRPFENFEWEFLQGPFGPAIYIVAIDTNVTNEVKVVGIQCAIPLELVSSKGEVVRTAKSEDTLVDPAYRGQKIFERMYDVLFDECSKAGIRYIWGFTPARKAFERIGFSIPYQTKQALMVFNPLPAFRYLKSLNPENTFKQKFQILGLSVLSYLRGIAGRGHSSSGYSLEGAELSALNSNFFEFYSGTKLFNLNASDTYLRWRIECNPFNNNYKAYSIRLNDQIVGMVVVNFRNDVSYVELVMTKDDRHLKPVLGIIASRMKKSKPALIRCLCFDHNDVLRTQYEQINHAGFFTLAKGNFFVWKALKDDTSIDSRELFLNRLFTQGNV
jgi:GNAT superfamily N-acetyltransferase